MVAELTMREQVRQALATFHEAHEAYQEAAAAFYDIDRTYKAAKLDAETNAAGTNDKQRAAAAKSVLESEYGDLLADHEAAEKAKIETGCHVERCEKQVNTLRDLLNSETAEAARGTADALGMAATIADTTAQRYAVLAGAKTTYAEIRARYPVKPTNGDIEIPEEELPF